MPSIATLVPAYNAAQHIEQALDSVAAQTRLPDQIIVVDDGSRDATADIVRRWADQHDSIALHLVQQANAGASAARNAAILATDADYIAFLDADDLYEPAHHALLSGALERHPSLAIAFGQQSVFTAEGETCDNFLRGKPIEQVNFDAQADGLRLLGDGLWAALIQGNFIPTSGSMARRQAVLDAGLMDTGLKTSEDRDLWLRVSRFGGLGYLPTRVARKREHETNLTGDANRAIVSLHAVEVVQKQLTHAAQLQLSTDEIDATRQALRRAAETMLYGASLGGLGNYRTARRRLDEIAPGYGGSGGWRGWARALRQSLSQSLQGS